MGKGPKQRDCNYRLLLCSLASYLSFDVYFAECGGTEALDLRRHFAELDPILVVAFVFNSVLCTVRFEKFTT